MFRSDRVRKRKKKRLQWLSICHPSKVLQLTSYSEKTCWPAVCKSNGRVWKPVGSVNDEMIQKELEFAMECRFLLLYKQLFLAERVLLKFEYIRIFTLVDETGSVVTPSDFLFAQHILVLQNCTSVPIDVCADGCEYGCEIEWKKITAEFKK